MSRDRRRRQETIVFLGMSGSGKDTQARRRMRAIPKSRQISPGAAFRRIARKDTLVGRYLVGIMRRGALVPYWAAAYVWLTELFERLTGEETLVFTGAPRRIEEARMLDDVMRNLGRPLPIAMYLELSPAVARRRLIARGRFDDNPRAIAGRFAFFRAHVLPVIRYYRNRGRLVTINGDQPVPAVWRDI